MNNVINIAKNAIQYKNQLPFSVYSSYKEQKINNVPILKPLLIFILNGTKQLGNTDLVECQSGSFVFLSNSPRIDMRNIPIQEEYFAVLIDFDHDDFSELPKNSLPSKKYFQGEINDLLTSTLSQYIEFCSFAPLHVMKRRKREILEIIYYSGYSDVCNIIKSMNVSEKVQSMILEDVAFDWSVELIASNLFMSTSTLRRKLKSEGNTLQDIKNRARLGYGLHLLQTTQLQIGYIAERCGYQSQSRFTDQFKLLFGMTPREIRKTKMID